MHIKLSSRTLPAPSATRTRARFAWWPVRIGDALYWMEQYEVLEAFILPPPVMVNGQAVQGIGQWLVYAKKPVKWKPA